MEGFRLYPLHLVGQLQGVRKLLDHAGRQRWPPTKQGKIPGQRWKDSGYSHQAQQQHGPIRERFRLCLLHLVDQLQDGRKLLDHAGRQRWPPTETRKDSGPKVEGFRL
uniref:hypothetical protein n=1 Tax=Aquipseudomonas alcaligenes TaxID=43263 RepID=UPI00155D9CAA|nr:hypothetical protein [Pseudomonas alcaligenes]